MHAEATKRGLGSALLRNPRKLARLVSGIAEGINLPLTVKVRTGTSASKINVQEVGCFCIADKWHAAHFTQSCTPILLMCKRFIMYLRAPVTYLDCCKVSLSEHWYGKMQVVSLLQDAGAAAVTIHGRTAEQRYIMMRLGHC